MNRIVIWGTGGNADEVMTLFPRDRAELGAFIDSNPTRQGISFHERQILPPLALTDIDFDCLAIASCHYEEIKQAALELGVVEDKICRASSLFPLLSSSSGLSFETALAYSQVNWWYHAYDVLPGLHTPGICPYKQSLLDFPCVSDLTGKRVLDIGAWDGPYTLVMAKRGAQVTALDIQRPDRTGFNFMCAANNIDAKHICSSVYDLNPRDHGRFDLVTFFGVYYHLRNPIAAFANINSVLPEGGLMIVEGAVLEGAPKIDPYWKENAHILDHVKDVPIAYFVEHEFQGEWSNWWVPNVCCLKQWITSCGFEILSFDTIEGDTRAFCLAKKLRDMEIEHIVC